MMSEDRANALRLVPVSRETLARLDRFAEILLEWTPRLNLIAPSTIPNLWTRHIADSLQLIELSPGAKTWIDLGSGAGFPGLAIACALAETPGTVVHLVESTQKKANFLREASSHIGARTEVHAVRIEDFVKNNRLRAEVVTARALAPLDRLLDLAAPLLKTGAQGLFPKGQDIEAELTQAAKCWKFERVLVPSKTNPLSRIVVVRNPERRTAKR
jgi:16S rRNA (guanine527-N7)-methyltransferase